MSETPEALPWLCKKPGLAKVASLPGPRSSALQEGSTLQLLDQPAQHPLSLERHVNSQVERATGDLDLPPLPNNY